MPSLKLGEERYVFKIRVTPPPRRQRTRTGHRPHRDRCSNEDSITVSWNAIADVDRYTVEHSERLQFWLQVNHQNATSRAAIRRRRPSPSTELTATTTYYIRVYATNGDGDGLRSGTADSDDQRRFLLQQWRHPRPRRPPTWTSTRQARPTTCTTPIRRRTKGKRQRRKARRATLKKLKADWEEVTIPSGAVTYKVEWRTARGESYTR